jgi:hypothetical protein
MFYFPDKITLAVVSQDVAARFNGASSNCVVEANIPCSIDFKKSATGEANRRVQTDAKVIVHWTEGNQDLFQIGAQFLIDRLKNVFWEVLAIDEHEGVFGCARTLELRVVRKPGQMVASGTASVRQELARMKASVNRPGGPTGAK